MNQNFREFFASLNTQAVEFMVIGGVAYNFYAPPRATKDIDIWVGPARDNLQRMIATIAAFGFPTDELEIQDLQRNRRVIMGTPRAGPLRGRSGVVLGRDRPDSQQEGIRAPT